MGYDINTLKNLLEQLDSINFIENFHLVNKESFETTSYDNLDGYAIYPDINKNVIETLSDLNTINSNNEIDYDIENFGNEYKKEIDEIEPLMNALDKQNKIFMKNLKKNKRVERNIIEYFDGESKYMDSLIESLEDDNLLEDFGLFRRARRGFRRAFRRKRFRRVFRRKRFRRVFRRTRRVFRRVTRRVTRVGSNTFNKMRKQAQNWANKTRKAARDAANRAKRASQNAANRVKKGAQNYANRVKRAAEKAAKKVRDQAKRSIDKMRRNAINYANKVKNEATRIKNTASSKLREAANKLKENIRLNKIAKNLLNKARGVANSIKDKALKAAKATRNAAEKAAKATRNVAEKAAKATRNAAEKAAKATRNAAEKVAKLTKDKALQTMNKAKDLVNKAKDTAKGIIDKAKATGQASIDIAKKQAAQLSQVALDQKSMYDKNFGKIKEDKILVEKQKKEFELEKARLDDIKRKKLVFDNTNLSDSESVKKSSSGKLNTDSMNKSLTYIGIGAILILVIYLVIKFTGSKTSATEEVVESTSS